MAERTYVIGLPAAITVHSSGAVTLNVDLSEADDFDCMDRPWDDAADADRPVVSEAASRLGNCLTFIINPRLRRQS